MLSLGTGMIRAAGKQKQAGGSGQRDRRDPVMTPQYGQGL